jgi:hypothetical protein
MVERKLPKLHTRVRFPSPAPALGRLFLRRTIVLSAAALLCSSSLAFAAVERFVCRHRTDQDLPTMTISIDTASKTIAITPNSGLEPMEGSLEISATTFSWGFMRGSADLDRKTGKLAWDATPEYDYLDYIGQKPHEARETFTGRMQCKAAP